MKTARFIAAVVTSTCLLCAHVKAEDVTVPTDGGAQLPAIAPVKEGDRAPFEGVVFSTEAVANIIAEKKAVPDQIKNEVTRAVNEEKANCAADAAKSSASAKADLHVVEAKLDASIKERELVAAELKRRERQSKMQKVWIVLSGVAGLVVSGVVVGLSVNASR